MCRLKETPPVMAMKYIHTAPSSFQAAHEEPVDVLVARAAIFHKRDGSPHLLIMQRAATDSMPNKWELPGGGIEDEDTSIKDALIREIKEETGLTASWIVQEIGSGERYEKIKDGKTQRHMTIYFVVEIEEIELLERGLADGTQKTVQLTLADSEHQRYLWVSEPELQDGKAQGYDITDTPGGASMRKVMMKSFEVEKHVLAARAETEETAKI